MPLQNRVDPRGALHCDPARGLFTGNRGVIHDPETKTLTGRRWTTKSWIICACDYRGRRRDVWGRNARSGAAGWTELFFLDEVTALAAGHRPCFQCRREAARAYAEAFGRAFAISRPKVADMDTKLHAERFLSASQRGAPPVTRIEDCPDGVVFCDGQRFLTRRRGKTLQWSFDGYRPIDAAERPGELSLVTPPASVAVLAAGFNPAWHASADR